MQTVGLSSSLYRHNHGFASISTILISNLASISIESEEVPVTASLIPLFLIAALELLGSALSFRSQKFFNLMSGRPKTVILDGQIDQNALRTLRLTTADLMEALRGKNIFDPRDVSYAVVETNGSLSAALRPEKETATLADLQLKVEHSHATIPFVLDGQVLEENLHWCGKDQDWLERTAQANTLLPQEIQNTPDIPCFQEKYIAIYSPQTGHHSRGRPYSLINGAIPKDSLIGISKVYGHLLGLLLQRTLKNQLYQTAIRRVKQSLPQTHFLLEKLPIILSHTGLHRKMLWIVALHHYPPRYFPSACSACCLGNQHKNPFRRPKIRHIQSRIRTKDTYSCYIGNIVALGYHLGA